MDDTEQTFLNGKLIGQNGFLIPVDTESTDDFTGDREAYKVIRKYVLPVNDNRILWDQENTIAIRVHDHGGNGGMFGTKSSISMLDLKEFFKIRTNETTFQLINENEFRKTIELENISDKDTYEGWFSVEITRSDNSEMIYRSSFDVSIDPGQEKIIDYSFSSPHSISHQALYKFEEKANKTIVSTSQMVPYILTPKPGVIPQINGAKVYGVRSGSPFLYRIPATGNRPMIFIVEDLPPGLLVDKNTGIITGKISKAGTYSVILKAKNQYGESTRKFKIIVGSTLALTPPMGWNSWYIHYHRVSDKLMREAADAMINSGMADYGYQYVNIDDCWMVKANSDDPIIGGRLRDERGEILANKKFPDMKAMTSYIHSKGLKAGTYIS
ncbi:MAG: putative Ig domain-containing protein, partial [Bacteroidales bacterium]|nr:putative Ig domain-containing protein [Bacteroidales bacterium]